MGDAQDHMTEEHHAAYMRRALDLAARGHGLTSPNPVVGCVVVKNGAIIGEGWHMGPGRDHAEVAALKAAGQSAKDASVYVTLEPCNHFGRTPPCSQALIQNGVKEVFYALGDPNPLAAGGASTLKEAGIAVHCGILKDEACKLNRIWLHNVNSDRPYVIAKFAMSLDGKIASRTGHSQWITGAEARMRGHDLRRLCDAIIVGADTVIADDPALTARPEDVPTDYLYNDFQERIQPLRVVMDSNARTAPGAKAYDRTSPGALIAVTSSITPQKRKQFEEHGVQILPVASDQNRRPDAESLLISLKSQGCQSVLIEGGANVLGAYFDAGLVDEVWAFIAPMVIGGAGLAPIGGLGADRLDDALRLDEVETEHLGSDYLIRGLARKPQDTTKESG